MKKTIFLLCSIIALLVTIANAQAPEKITYQAVIRNSNDELIVNSTIGIRISIFQNSSTEILVYEDTQTTLTNNNGLISIIIGEGIGFDTINWSTGPYFIKTEVDILGGTDYTITGTSQLLSVPYALHSKTTEEAMSIDYENIVNAPQYNYYWADKDGDGYGYKFGAIYAPASPDGYVSNFDDCNDDNADSYPNATEICDNLDNDCNGLIDDNAVDAITWYVDNDNDGFGNIDTVIYACSQPLGYVNNSTDCNDADSAIHPGATEICDSLDNDCNGFIDDNPNDILSWYQDLDEDGYGNLNNMIESCQQPVGYINNSLDCDDNDSDIHPGATEICDNLDNDCNGSVDDNANDFLSWYQDADADGYGDINIMIQACQQPLGYVNNSTDCDDGDSNVYPGAAEFCDNVDNNCNGVVDESGAIGSINYYQDADADGYGNINITIQACSQPLGYVDNSSDCDDNDATIYPNAVETPGDNTDSNCDGFD